MTLNQQYKMSGSEKPFKEWLFERQSNGELDLKKENLNQKLNAAGDEKVDISLFGIPVLYIGIGVVAIIAGVVIYNRLKK
jgi:hypothetical protein